MSLQFSDVVRGAELPHYYASTAKGRINFVFHHVSDRPYFFETSSIQFYKNTDTNTLMIKDFSFPLYNGNNEFFVVIVCFFVVLVLKILLIIMLVGFILKLIMALHLLL